MAPPVLPYSNYGIDKPILPYRSNTSVVDESPHWVRGSNNCVATIGGWMNKRPGFTRSLESAISTIPGTIVRLYTWRRWSSSTTHAGAFITMLCAVDATAGTSSVWKYEQGSDASFVHIYTDTTSAKPFDFIVSRNFCFFGNETTRANNRKFDGDQVTLWGVDPPAASPEVGLVRGTLPPGLSFDTATGTLHGTPTATGTSQLTLTAYDSLGNNTVRTYTFTVGPNEPRWNTNALPPAVDGSAYSVTLSVTGGVTPYAYAVSSGALPTGITLNAATGVLSGTPSGTGSYAFGLKVTDASGNSASKAFFLFVSSSNFTVTPTSANGNESDYSVITFTAAGGSTPYTYALVGGLPSGMSFADGTLTGAPSPSGIYNMTIQAADSTGAVVQIPFKFTVDASLVEFQSLVAPDAQLNQPYTYTFAVTGGASPYSLAFSAGALTAQTGYVYGLTYTSKYGHESSMSTLSDTTGLFTDQDCSVSLISSSDPQVTGMNLYRTPDGGTADPAQMRLVVSLGNATQTYIDTTLDNDLGDQTGPSLFVNDPPQPMSGLIWSNGRIWGKNAANTLFTGNEEVTNGIPEECMSFATDGNYYSWPNEVGGMAATPEGVDIALSEQFWQISGSNLATFQKNVLLTGGGCPATTNLCAVGSTVFWIDTAKQLFDSSEGEIGLPIRPDLEGLIPDQSFVAYHKSKTLNLLCVLDAANGKLFTYDLDLKQWNTPWLVPGMTCITSGEVTRGNIELIAAYSNGHVRMLSPGQFLDDDAPYGEVLVSQLTAITSGRGTTGRNRDAVRRVQWFEAEVSTYPDPDNPGDHKARTPDAVKATVDDDPVQSFAGDYYVDLTEFIEPMQYQDSTIPKRFINASRWGANTMPEGARTSFAFIWVPSPLNWSLYSFDTVWTP